MRPCYECRYNQADQRWPLNRNSNRSVYCEILELRLCSQNKYYLWKDRDDTDTEDDFLSIEEMEI